jgi:hypothetical protein
VLGEGAALLPDEQKTVCVHLTLLAHPPHHRPQQHTHRYAPEVNIKLCTPVQEGEGKGEAPAPAPAPPVAGAQPNAALTRRLTGPGGRAPRPAWHAKAVTSLAEAAAPHPTIPAPSPSLAPLPPPAVNSRPHVVIMGDSHAVHWLPALYAAGRAAGWAVSGLTKSSCLPANVTVELVSRGAAGRPYTECRAWVDKAVAWLVRARPAAVILSCSPKYNLPGLDRNASRPNLGEGVVHVVRALARAGIPALAIKHTPFRVEAVPACLAGATARGLDTAGAIAACTVRAEDALPTYEGALTEAAAQFDGLRLLDFDDVFVDARGQCPPIIGNVIVHRDAHHMTASFSQTLAPALARRLSVALPGVL